MSVNAGNLGNYADAFAQTGDERWLRAARSIQRWMRRFLKTREGTFFASQDADPPGGISGERYFRLSDPERVRRGIPRVDRSVYAAENGLVIQAFCRLHAATDRQTTLREAIFCAKQILATHRAPDGALRHAPRDRVLFLHDQTAFHDQGFTG